MVPVLRRGRVSGSARLGGPQRLRRVVRDARFGWQGTVPGWSGGLAQGRPGACRRARDGLHRRERRYGWCAVGGPGGCVGEQRADRAVQLDPELHRGHVRRQVHRVPRVPRRLQDGCVVGPEPGDHTRLWQPEGRLPQAGRLVGLPRQVAHRLRRGPADELHEPRHRPVGDVRRHRRHGARGCGRQMAGRQLRPLDRLDRRRRERMPRGTCCCGGFR